MEGLIKRLYDQYGSHPFITQLMINYKKQKK